ncbi:hypothetical protein G6F23_015660 [Rhizopus arrhizus]|nr:hypothetical protein G6F23_015660 [Rhizopus arrhizus]
MAAPGADRRAGRRGRAACRQQRRGVAARGQWRAAAAGRDGPATPGRLAGRAHDGRTEAAAGAVLLQLQRDR